MMSTRRVCLFVGALTILSQVILFITLHSNDTLRMLQSDERFVDMMILAERERHDGAALSSILSPLLEQEAPAEDHHNNHATNYTIKQQPSKKRLLAHLHIGKNGGTSLDGLLVGLVRKQLNYTYQYKGFRHFDWSYIETLQQQQEHHVDVVTMIRSPVERAYSHFESAKIWNKELRASSMQHYGNLTMKTYLNDKELMMNTRSIWLDGQAGVSWLTGTHTEEWVVGSDLNETERTRRETLQETNKTALIMQAADRLEYQTLWFGIMEDLPRSMELLRHALNLTETPVLPRGNANPNGDKPSLAQWEHDAIASLMPMDMWLYDYAKRLFEARYTAMTTRVLIKPERPPLSETWSCVSNRTILKCVDGPFKDLSYTYKPSLTSRIVRGSKNNAR